MELKCFLCKNEAHFFVEQTTYCRVFDFLSNFNFISEINNN